MDNIDFVFFFVETLLIGFLILMIVRHIANYLFMNHTKTFTSETPNEMEKRHIREIVALCKMANYLVKESKEINNKTLTEQTMLLQHIKEKNEELNVLFERWKKERSRWEEKYKR